jgi:hypothetical protein
MPPKNPLLTVHRPPPTEHFLHMHPFPHFLNLHAGRPFVVIGKGPSLDAWLAAGCPQPDGALRIGVNHAGGAVACDYNVSVHDIVDKPEWRDIPGTWFTGLPQPPLNPHPERSGHEVRCLWREPHAQWFLTTFREEVLTWPREKLALLPWLYVWSSSAQPAIHLAWFMGAASLMLVGMDGGTMQAQASQAVPGGQSPEQDYTRFREHTTKAADALFGPRWHHWQPAQPLQKTEGELWKYRGIYQSQEQPNSPFRGYGHSNHGQRALPWLLEQGFTSLLDVGCGHNEFVKAWREKVEGEKSDVRSQTAEAPLTSHVSPLTLSSQGVDFACPNADVIAPATALPFGDAAFDVVTSFDMLEHLPEAEVMPSLREMRRVSRTAFCFSIATAPSRILWQGQNLHPTVKPLEWWLDRIREAGGEPEVGDGYVRGRWQASGRTKPE